MSNYKSPRLYVSDPIKDGQEINLLPAHVHYLSGVMRLKEGAEIRIFNSRDGEWISTFHPINKKTATLRASENIKPQPSTKRRIHLIFAPIKKQRMDFMVEKAVELGATDLHPILTQNTEVRKINTERVQAQIIEATEQCERLDLPTLHALEAMDKKCTGWDKSTTLLCGLERHECPHISAFKNEKDVAFLIGPEGGFTKEEVTMLTSLDQITPVNLGDTILRAETAALYGLSILSTKLCAIGDVLVGRDEDN